MLKLSGTTISRTLTTNPCYLQLVEAAANSRLKNNRPTVPVDFHATRVRTSVTAARASILSMLKEKF